MQSTYKQIDSWAFCQELGYTLGNALDCVTRAVEAKDKGTRESLYREALNFLFVFQTRARFTDDTLNIFIAERDFPAEVSAALRTLLCAPKGVQQLIDALRHELDGERN